MKTYKQTLFISIISSLLLLSAVSKVHAAGTVHFFLSGGGLVDSLQSFDYANKRGSPESEGGVGLLLDFISEEGHAFAIDSYAFSENYEPSGTDDDATGLLLGYRYHFPAGFYLGGGIMATSLYTTISVTLASGNVVPGRIELGEDNVLALTLGYQTAFSNGLSLGTHLLYSLPEDLDSSVFRYDEFSIQSLGFIIGYAWGNNS